MSLCGAVGVSCSSEPSPPRRPAIEVGPTAPNILVFVTDDQRPGTLGVMPTVRSWFGDGGTRFTRAFATTPLCCPSRATIFTGRYAHNHGVRTNVEAKDLRQGTTVQRALHDAGYLTGIAGKYLNWWPLDEDPPSFDRWAIFGNKYYDRPFNVDGRRITVHQYSTDFIAERSAEFLRSWDSTDDHRPWLLFVTTSAPHEPWIPKPEHEDAPIPPWRLTPAMTEENLSDKPAIVRTSPQLPRDEIRRNRAGQLRTLMGVDDAVGTLVGALRSLGEEEDTLAFFLSDNGFLWGDHGLAGTVPDPESSEPKPSGKRYPYTPSIQVPFLARWPGVIPAGAVDGGFVGNVDVAATIYDATGVSPYDRIDGRSLLSGTRRDRMLIEYFGDPTYGTIPSWASEVTPEYQYVEWYGKNREITFREYYDLTHDPWQLRNLLRDGHPENDPDVSEISSRLALDRECSGRSGPTSCP